MCSCYCACSFLIKGRRKCLGETLAHMELYVFSSAILQNFHIELPPGKVLKCKVNENFSRTPEIQEFTYRVRN